MNSDKLEQKRNIVGNSKEKDLSQESKDLISNRRKKTTRLTHFENFTHSQHKVKHQANITSSKSPSINSERFQYSHIFLYN
jgi:hypothetical protein